MRRSTPSCTWDRTSATAVSDASVVRIKGTSKFGYARTGFYTARFEMLKVLLLTRAHCDRLVILGQQCDMPCSFGKIRH